MAEAANFLNLPSVTTLNLDHQASPGSVGLFLCQGRNGFFYACNSAGAADFFVSLADGDRVFVTHNADPAANLNGVAVYAVEANAGQNNVLRAVVPTNADAFVETLHGKVIKVTDSDSAASGTVQLFCLHSAAAADRIRGTFAGAADITVKTHGGMQKLVEVNA